MELHELRPSPGSVKERKRVGRGRAAGGGKTAGRGQKGQKSRSGGTKGPGFEGGQNPLQMRLPKLGGFKNRFRRPFQVLNVEDLNAFSAGSEVDISALAERGLVDAKSGRVKILGEGELKVALTVTAHAFSASAQRKIEAAGGKVLVG